MTLDLPSWAWVVPVALVGILRPRILWAIVRGLVMLAGAIVLAIFAGVCL